MLLWVDLRPDNSKINYIFLLSKYFIWLCRFNQRKPCLDAFLRFANFNYLIEKKDPQSTHKWEPFLPFLNSWMVWKPYVSRKRSVQICRKISWLPNPKAPLQHIYKQCYNFFPFLVGTFFSFVFFVFFLSLFLFLFVLFLLM